MVRESVQQQFNASLINSHKLENQQKLTFPLRKFGSYTFSGLIRNTKYGIPYLFKNC